MDAENEQNELYIQLSKKNINDAIYNADYKKAFMLLIMVLDRLDADEKVEFIEYYNTKIYDTRLSHMIRLWFWFTHKTSRLQVWNNNIELAVWF